MKDRFIQFKCETISKGLKIKVIYEAENEKK